MTGVAFWSADYNQQPKRITRGGEFFDFTVDCVAHALKMTATLP